MSRAWTLLSIGGEPQYGGNRGYEDDPSRFYRYDSSVPNHLQVRSGDLIFVRDRSRVIGVGRVEAVIEGSGVKVRRKCPECGKTYIKRRKGKQPTWRCTSGHEFDEPDTEEIAVRTYEAQYSATFTPLRNSISVADLKRAALRPNDQLAIEEVDAGLVFSKSQLTDSISEMLSRHLQNVDPDQWEQYQGIFDDGRSDQPSYEPRAGDTRTKIVRTIAARRGQPKFRKSLIKRYGARCMITGCGLMDIVEAAHIWPYRGDDDHHPENGLLLRGDLHTLFDLDLLAISPRDLRITLHPAVSAFGYDTMEGLILQGCEKQKPSLFALEHRWHIFREKCGSPSK
ncbi:MAG: HNH endonuclease [Rhodospirillaceae bacterium]